MCYIYLFASTVESDNPLTLLPVHNVTISNVTDVDDIAVIIEWLPPADPNGIIVYYRVQYMQESNPFDNANGSDSGRRKQNIPLNTTVVTVFTNITEGSNGAPTNIKLRGLG